MYHLRRLTIVAVFLSTVVFLLWFLPRALNPTPPSSEDRLRDKRWVDSSPYWIDRQACRWLTLCGIHHVRSDPASHTGSDDDDAGDLEELVELRKRSLWTRYDENGNAINRPNAEKWAFVRQRNGRQQSHRDVSTLQRVPDYVLKYAPLIHLHSEEYFFPSDIADHIEHMVPFVNGSALNLSKHLRLEDLHELDAQRPTPVYLTSEEDVEDRPGWLHSHSGKPMPFVGDGENGGSSHLGSPGDHKSSGPQKDGTTWWDVDKDHPLRRITGPRRQTTGRHGRRPFLSRRGQKPLASPVLPMYKPGSDGYSDAPAVLVLVDKGSGILDAFWFFFYSYNLGQTVIKIRFGNHVGDWEHCMVRFENGVPRALFMSEHAGGQAYAWSALEKLRAKNRGSGPEETVDRPVIYSAIGSHAMYAAPGNHPYVLPFGMLKDETDRGPLWDPAQNTYAYFYDYEANRREDEEGGGGDDDTAKRTSLVPAASNPDAPTSWFHFAGPWGDELYALSDVRQWRLFGQYHYITGPQGPKFKNLDRRNVCQTERCTILYDIEAGKKQSWYK